jgi:HEPN domain-containing protein
MANKTYAIEWLTKSKHDLEGARLLFEANHYTDTIGYVLHQSLEKMLKSILAYENKPILKTHNLVELYELMPDHILLDDEKIYLLSIATTYQTQQRYPVVQKKIPHREEILQILDLSQDIFEYICSNLNIDKIF